MSNIRKKVTKSTEPSLKCMTKDIDDKHSKTAKESDDKSRINQVLSIDAPSRSSDKSDEVSTVVTQISSPAMVAQHTASTSSINISGESTKTSSSNGSGAKNKRFAGRVVASRYKSHVNKSPKSPKHTFDTTPMVWNGGTRKKFGTSQIQCTSTPAAHKPNLYHDASSIVSEKSYMGPSLKSNLTKTATLTAKQRSKVEKNLADKKWPLAVLPGASSGNDTNYDDDAVLLAYNQYLQATYLQDMQEAAFRSQKKHAEETLYSLCALILDLQDKKKELHQKEYQLDHLKELDNLLSYLGEPLKKLENQLTHMTIPYKELCSTIDETRDRLLLKDALIENEEHLMKLLNEASAALRPIHQSLNAQYGVFESASNRLAEINKLSREKSEIVSDCENLLQLVDSLVIEKGSLAIPTKH